jgi:hypothetical protein
MKNLAKGEESSESVNLLLKSKVETSSRSNALFEIWPMDSESGKFSATFWRLNASTN